MFRIAICDDERETCNQIFDMLMGATELPAVKIDLFFCGRDLCKAVQGGNQHNQYDLFIINAKLEFISGVQVGQMIRNEPTQKYAQILFIAEDDSCVMDLFDLRPLNFLVKPLFHEKVTVCVMHAIELLGKDAPFFSYSRRKKVYREAYRDIAYFESKGRTVYIHTEAEICQVSMRLSEILADGLPSSFIQVHQSYIVNFNYVKQFEYTKVTMTNGEEVPVSYSHRKKARELMLAAAGLS